MVDRVQNLSPKHSAFTHPLPRLPSQGAIRDSNLQYEQKGHITQPGTMPAAQNHHLSLAQDGFAGRLDRAGPPHQCQAPESKSVMLKAEG